MLQDVVDRLDVGIGIDDVFRHPPSLDGAIRKRDCGADELAFLETAVHHVRQQVDPALRRDVRLALLDHRCDGRHRVADDQLCTAAVAFGQNELVHTRQDFGALPVHVGNRHIAAFRRRCRAAESQKTAARHVVARSFFISAPSVLAVSLWRTASLTAAADSDGTSTRPGPMPGRDSSRANRYLFGPVPPTLLSCLSGKHFPICVSG